METYQALADELLHKQNCEQPYWLAIAGPPGSGKSTLAKELLDRVGRNMIVIPMDGYHFRRRQLDEFPDPQNAHARRGAPFTFDAHRMVEELRTARRRGAGGFPDFDHGIGDPEENAITLTDQHRLVVVEGNYLLLPEEPWCQLAEMFDETWFLNVAAEECDRRVYERHVKTGESPEVARRRVLSNDGLNVRLVIAQCRDRSDRVITMPETSDD